MTSFAHAGAISNITFRVHYQYNTTQKDKSDPSSPQKWYTSIYNSDPRCAFPECLRLLPRPRTVKMNVMRASISVGTPDSRTGSSRTRSFISNRFGPIYPCLVTWLLAYEPHPVMINTFLWYGGLYHTDSSCKAARGKWLQNF
jgi:hypothetical protein